MFRLSSRREFGFVAIGIAVIGYAFPCVRAEDAENARPATSLEDFKQRHAELTAKANEVGREISTLNQELKARQEEIDSTVEIQNLRKQATEAKQAVAAFLKTDATLVELRQAREKTQAAVEAARRTFLDTTDEAKALYKQRAEVELKDAMLAFKIRETEFVMERHVLPRLYRDNADLPAARTRKETLGRQMQQARSDAENNSKELKDLRDAVDKARAASDAARPALSNDLTKARTEKEAALRDLSTETLKDEDKALTDARNNAAKVRADIAAKDAEALAATEKLAELNKQRADIKKTCDEKQAALRALRAKAPGSGDKPPADARNTDAKADADAAAVDREAAALTENLAELDKQRAELDYQSALVELKLREDVGRRIGLDPDVRKAEAAAADAEKARRAKEETSPALAAARTELEELRRKIGELEAAANAAPGAAAARADRAAKEKRLSALRAKLGADAVAGMNPAFDEAAKAEEALRVKKLAGDEEAGRLSRAKEETIKERTAVGARRQEIETELRKLYDKTADAEAIKPLNEAAAAALKAYDQAYATSGIQNLLEAERKAAAALAQRTAELRNADEKCSALNARIAAARAKTGAINAEIRVLGK
jgi:colicin import membrane protein